MTFAIAYRQIAIDDLDELAAWIERAADRRTADRYLARVRRKIDTLTDFPYRGVARDDLQPGVRSIGFERRLIIFYIVAGQTVEIVHVVNGTRDLPPLFDT